MSDTFSYQWFSNGTAVGTNSATYVTQSTDVGKQISCAVTAADAAGANTVQTNSTSVVQPGASGNTPQTMGLGISLSQTAFFTNMSDGGASQFAAMHTAGVRHIRFSIAGTGGTAAVTGFETLANAILAAGIDVCLTITGINNYYSTTTQLVAYSTFATFCQNMATHYSQSANGAITTYEVLNEPNTGAGWVSAAGGGAVAPSQYLTLLQACYPALKNGGATTVSFAGLAGSVSGWTGVEGGIGDAPPSQFMSICYAANGGSLSNCCDVQGAHNSTYTTGLPSLTSGAWEEFYAATSVTNAGAGFPSVRAQMINNGDPNMPLWITSFGVPTGTVGGFPAESLVLEAQSYTTAYSILQSNNLNFTTRFYGYTWADTNTEDFGLLTNSLAQKSVPAGSYGTQPSGVTTVLGAYSQGVIFATAFITTIPVNSTAPTILGTTQVGDVLTVTTGTWQ